MSSRIAGVIVLATCTTGCTLEADLQSVCATRHGVEVEAAPVEATEEVTLAFDVDVALGALGALDRFDPELRFDHVRMRAIAGIDGFQFVDAAEITAASDALPTLIIGDCAGDCEGESSLDLLVISQLGDLDALDYLAAGTLAVGATIRGALPTVPWTMDIEVCTEGSAGY